MTFALTSLFGAPFSSPTMLAGLRKIAAVIERELTK
jgi:hypothetical protein